MQLANTYTRGVARGFQVGRLAHSEGQNEEENEKSLKKSKKNWSKFEEKNEESRTFVHPGLWGWLRPWLYAHTNIFTKKKKKKKLLLRPTLYLILRLNILREIYFGMIYTRVGQKFLQSPSFSSYGQIYTKVAGFIKYEPLSFISCNMVSVAGLVALQH